VGVASPGSADALGCAIGADDGASFRVVAAGPQAAMHMTTTRSRVFTHESVATEWPRGPDFAEGAVNRYEFHGGASMPPRGVKSAKRKRQYEHIKRSETARGRSNNTAERIAAATTNKTRAEKGETK
jgi:hypothetical protein